MDIKDIALKNKYKNYSTITFKFMKDWDNGGKTHPKVKEGDFLHYIYNEDTRSTAVFNSDGELIQEYV